MRESTARLQTAQGRGEGGANGDHAPTKWCAGNHTSGDYPTTDAIHSTLSLASKSSRKGGDIGLHIQQWGTNAFPSLPPVCPSVLYVRLELTKKTVVRMVVLLTK